MARRLGLAVFVGLLAVGASILTGRQSVTVSVPLPHAVIVRLPHVEVVPRLDPDCEEPFFNGEIDGDEFERRYDEVDARWVTEFEARSRQAMAEVESTAWCGRCRGRWVLPSGSRTGRCWAKSERLDGLEVRRDEGEHRVPIGTEGPDQVVDVRAREVEAPRGLDHVPALRFEGVVQKADLEAAGRLLEGGRPLRLGRGGGRREEV